MMSLSTGCSSGPAPFLQIHGKQRSLIVVVFSGLFLRNMSHGICLRDSCLFHRSKTLIPAAGFIGNGAFDQAFCNQRINIGLHGIGHGINVKVLYNFLTCSRDLQKSEQVFFFI